MHVDQKEADVVDLQVQVLVLEVVELVKSVAKIEPRLGSGWLR